MEDDDELRGALELYLYRENRPTKKLDKMKEFLNEKISYLKDAIGNNKRQTAYVVATLSSGAAGYALTGMPEVGLDTAIILAGISIADASTRNFKKRFISRNQV